MSLHKTIEATVRDYMQSYVDASKTKDMSQTARTLVPGGLRYVGPPAFLKTQGAPPDLALTPEAYSEEFHGMTLYEIDRYEIYNLVVDVEGRKAAARTELFVRFYSGETGSRNHIWFFDLTDDGTKITKLYSHNEVEEAANWRKDIEDRKEQSKA